MKELVLSVARGLANRPEEIAVAETEEEGSLSIDLTVSPEDLGRVIGREGRTARALRNFVSAAARKKNLRVAVRIRG